MTVEKSYGMFNAELQLREEMMNGTNVVIASVVTAFVLLLVFLVGLLLRRTWLNQGKCPVCGSKTLSAVSVFETAHRQVIRVMCSSCDLSATLWSCPHAGHDVLNPINQLNCKSCNRVRPLEIKV